MSACMMVGRGRLFGLNACRGAVRLVDGKFICEWHQKKREVFGLSPSRPVPPSPNRDVCPARGHTWILR